MAMQAIYAAAKSKGDDADVMAHVDGTPPTPEEMYKVLNALEKKKEKGKKSKKAKAMK